MNANECFVIMPMSDAPDYITGHFRKVYDCIFRPAIEMAGYIPRRGDEVLETNLIHLDILQRLINTPMAICDLTSRNPNVMFELGLRQAFDMPVVLVQEKGTPQIFDIGPIRYMEYDATLSYEEVCRDQEALKDTILATKTAAEKRTGVNSLVNLLSISKPASLIDINESNITQMLQIIVTELGYLRSDIQSIKQQEISNKFSSLDKEVKSLKQIDDYFVQEMIIDIENDLNEIQIDIQNGFPYVQRKSKLNRVRSKIFALRNGASSLDVREKADRLFQSMEELFVDNIHDAGP